MLSVHCCYRFAQVLAQPCAGSCMLALRVRKLYIGVGVLWTFCVYRHLSNGKHLVRNEMRNKIPLFHKICGTIWEGTYMWNTGLLFPNKTISKTVNNLYDPFSSTYVAICSCIFLCVFVAHLILSGLKGFVQAARQYLNCWQAVRSPFYKLCGRIVQLHPGR